ncbi:DUF937 domain-containing protein [Tellurirhabdus bombi]|uniref:DUF937 domain-containing protein n=1 Tax=Tellurirhabdus bombi TaxID=2907205 RepID=UPI001F3651A7|nr:DUF937 domain-containing protein [Tellurirhabdus bombi]
MLDILMNLVRQNTGGSGLTGSAIPNGQSEDAVKTVSNGILGGLQQQVTSGNLGGLISMFTGKGGSVEQNPVTGQVSNHVGDQLQQRFGISTQQAMSIAAAIVPIVLSKLVHKSNDPQDSSVSTGDIMGNLTGKQGVDWASMAGSVMADGKLDMNDLTRLAGNFMGGGSSSSKEPEKQSGGLGGLLGGMFGR